LFDVEVEVEVTIVEDGNAKIKFNVKRNINVYIIM